jgi:hypothetical protein
LSKDTTKAIDCARTANEKKQPFRLSIQVQGVDSFIWVGAARASTGVMWTAVYDSDTSGGSRTGHVISESPCKSLKFARNSFACADPKGIP